MKKARRFMALALAMLMTFQPAITAFAEEPAAEVIEELAEQVIEAAEEETEAAEVETEAVEEESEAAEAETEAAEEETEAAEEESEAAEEESEAAEEESKAAEEAAETVKKEEVPAEKKAEAEELILTAEAEDGMQVTMTAKAGTFKYDEDLELVASVVTEAEAEEADADLEAKTKNDNVAKRVTYDIKVMHGEEEVEPLDGKKVQVSFALPEVPAGADAVSVYHHKDNGAVETIVDEEEVEGGEGVEVGNIEGETDSFSYYTVDFTYDEKTVSIPGNSYGTPLEDILAETGLTGTIAKAVAYQDAACTVPTEDGTVRDGEKALFSVFEIDGTWYVDAINAFQTEHGLIVTMDDGAEYKILVTDANALLNVKYIDENGTEQTVDGLANAVSKDDLTWGDDGNDGWYVVSGEITADQGYVVKGDVKLILADGSNLTVIGEDGQAAICVSGENNSLTIYGQSGSTGELVAFAGSGAAGIGGAYNKSGNNITINGGTISAFGKDGGAGIGGGYNGDAADITINGGSVSAEAAKMTDGDKACGAGIGSGCYSDAVNIAITGGSVQAVSENGAAIGAGTKGQVHGITISGNGTSVRATANGVGAALGGITDSSDITIEGGHVELIGSSTEKKAFGVNSSLYIDTANAIYESDDEACVVDGSLDKDKMTLYSGNDGYDLSSNLEKRFVLINQDEITRIITVGAQIGELFYGNPDSVCYSITDDGTGAGVGEISWYSDAAGTQSCDAPKGITVELKLINCNITNGSKTPAGTYYFTVTRGGATSNVAAYTVQKRSAKITSGSAEKVYDGTPLTCEDVMVDGFVDGEGAIVTVTGTQTEEGNSQNTFTFTAQTGTDFNNYEITTVYGKLKVKKAEFAVTAKHYNGKYDGEPHAFEVKVTDKDGKDITKSCEIIYSECRPDGSWSDWSSEVPAITDAGMMTVKAKVTKNKAEVITENYTLTVKKREITVTSGSATKAYDGNILTDSKCLVSGDGFVGEEGFKDSYPQATGQIAKKGVVVNTIDIKFNDKTNADNYAITKREGKLTVTKNLNPITISTGSASKKYDGTALSKDSYTYKGVLAAGDTLTAVLDCTGAKAPVNAGIYTNTIKSYMVVNGSAEDVTECYTFTEHDYGTLTINRRNITLTSETKCFVYDGERRIADNVTITGEGLAGGEKIAYSGFVVVQEITEEPVENVFTATTLDGFNPGNYNITYKYGKISVVSQIGLLGDDMVVLYDGNWHEAPAVKAGTAAPVEYSTSTDGTTWSSYTETVPTIKDAGILYIKAKVIDGNKIATADYTITVKPRNVKIVLYSKTKEYDGTPLALTSSEYSFSGDGFPDYQGVNLHIDAVSQTDVGSSINSATYDFKAGTEPSNYVITVVPGILTVTKNSKTVVITTNSDTKTYDGVALKRLSWAGTWDTASLGTDESNELCGSDKLEVLVTGTITDAGSAANTCTYRVVNNGRDVTENYNYKIQPGTLTVEPRSIVIKTAGAEKVYDGTPLTADRYTVAGDGFAGTDDFKTVTFAGSSRTNAGVAVNALDATAPYEFNEGTKASNYKVTVEPGYLKVNKRKVTVASGNAVSTYADCPAEGLANKNACIIGSYGFVPGEMADGYPKGGTVLEKPASEPKMPVSANNKIEYSWTGNGNPANYEITETYGILRIITNAASVVATGYTGIYDGKAHGGIVSTALEGAVITYSTDGKTWSSEPVTYTDVKKDPSTGKIETYKVHVKAVVGGNASTCSYSVTILPRELSLAAGSASKVYDGTALTCSEYTIGGDGFVAGEKPEISMTSGSTQTDAGQTYNAIKELSDSGTFKTSNYSISYINGTLEVSKRPVTLISADLEVMYDGQPHSKQSVTVSGMEFVEGQGADYGSFTVAQDAGTYKNIFEHTLKEGTASGNYEITPVFGTITVDPRQVTLTSESAGMTYDGTALTASNVEVSGDGFLPGEGLTYLVNGSRTNVGSSRNTFTYAFQTGTKEINYAVTKVEGTLEVTANESLRVEAPSVVEYNYDGKPHGDAAKAYIGAEPCEDAVIWYSADDGKTWTDEVPQITEAGSVNVKVMAIRTGYKRAETSYTLNVIAYRLIYVADDATGGSVPVDRNNYVYGSKAILMDNTNGLARSGYTFIGWYLNNRYGKIYAPGFSLTVTESLNLYAAWSENEEPKPESVGTSAAPVSNGQWNCGPDGTWTYRTNGLFKNTWGYIANPFAKPGQPAQGWFWFNKNGIMATGWRLIDGKWYYFNESSDGTKGMLLTNTVTPDGYRVDANGAWIQ